MTRWHRCFGASVDKCVQVKCVELKTKISVHIFDGRDTSLMRKNQHSRTINNILCPQGCLWLVVIISTPCCWQFLNYFLFFYTNKKAQREREIVKRNMARAKVFSYIDGYVGTRIQRFADAILFERCWYWWHSVYDTMKYI